MPDVRIAVVAMLAVGLSACASDFGSVGSSQRPAPPARTAAAQAPMAAPPPAQAASAPATETSRASPTVVAATIDSMMGNRIGSAMDDEDRQRAYSAQMDALNRGQAGMPISWKNPDTGRYGSVVPGPNYTDNGATCRAYTHTIYMSGRPETVRGSACRNPNGSWTPIG